MNRIIQLLIITFVVSSCSEVKTNNDTNEELNTLRAELDSLKNSIIEPSKDTKEDIATFLTFQDNNAENAMNFYVEIFENSRILNLQRWGKEGPGEEGRIMHATFNLNGSQFMCSDSPPIHQWGFTPAVSNFVECKSLSELEILFSKLSKNGTITMPLNNYGFSQRFGWIIDQFGVSWQLNLK
ncbi:VOC family protein [Winogradskyella sp. A3E31]|uniref:VOC family protein n=1 Tax=Winogradskyella sp. A3E31 TaxID=3349637 RepID=UPI00398B066B